MTKLAWFIFIFLISLIVIPLILVAIYISVLGAIGVLLFIILEMWLLLKYCVK